MQNKNNSPKFGIASLYLATLIFAVNAFLFRLAGNAMPAYVFIGVRYFSAGLLLWILLRGRGKRLNVGTYIVIALSAIIGKGVGGVLFVMATTKTPLLTLGILDLLEPVWILALASLLHQEKITKRSIISSAICMSGAGVLIMSKVGGSAGDTDVSYGLSGPIMAIAGTMLGVCSLVVSKRLLRKMDPMQFTALQMMFCGAPFLLYSGVTGNLGVLGNLPKSGLIALLLTITTNGALVFWLHNRGVKAASMTIVSQQAYIALATIAIISVVFLKEPLTKYSVLGCTLVLVGSLIGQPRSTMLSLLHHAEFEAKHVASALRHPELSLKQILAKAR
jgi:drug/metabolite transporter (DMT)-like permease